MEQPWWRFSSSAAEGAARGTFEAFNAHRVGRLYFPLANESGALSWTSPQLHGGLALSHHAQLAVPLTVEDFAHTLVRRDFWISVKNAPPFAASGISPETLNPNRSVSNTVEAGPGWFKLIRNQPEQFRVEVVLWCPADLTSAVEIMQVTVTNLSPRTLSFLPYAMIPLFARSADNLRDHRHVTALLHRILERRDGVIVSPTMSFDERGHKLNSLNYAVLAYGPGGKAPESVWGVETDFVGEGGTLAAPAAVWKRQRQPAGGKHEHAGKEAIAGFRFSEQNLKPGREATFTLLSGISAKTSAIAQWSRWIKHPANVKRSLEKTKNHWAKIADTITFSTGDRSLDQWLAWVNLQPALRRIYGNSYLPQFDYGRGGRGWRDLWQDCLALLLFDPERVRPMLMHNFGGIRIDGSNATIIGKQGEFIADRNNIPRTWMDHGIWPLYTTLLYVDQTGNLDFLLRKRSYFRDSQQFRCKQMDRHWTSKYGSQLRTRSGAVYQGTLLEHLLIQNLTAFFNAGQHNLCRLEGADWNDGLDMAEARGESVAFSAFYAWNLKRLAETASKLMASGIKTIAIAEELLLLLDHMPGRKAYFYTSAAAKQAALNRFLAAVAKDISGKQARLSLSHLIADLTAKSEDLKLRIRKQEWAKTAQGGLFNGYYDNAGKKIEGLAASGMRMTLTGQVFPIMSGIADESQVTQTVASVNRWLRDPRSGGIRLNTDFRSLQPDLGRAFSFAYGEKENGAVFSHMAVMYAYGLYLRRRPNEGRKVWASLYGLAANQQDGKIFPGLPEYFNGQRRGMYCYLSGSASWLIYLLLTQVFGIRGRLGDLIIDPQLTREDFGASHSLSVSFTFARRRMKVTFKNPTLAHAGSYHVAKLSCNGSALPISRDPQGHAILSKSMLSRLDKKTTSHIEAALI